MRSHLLLFACVAIPLAACSLFSGSDAPGLGLSDHDDAGTAHDSGSRSRSDGGTRTDAGARSDGGSQSNADGGESGGGGGVGCSSLSTCCDTLEASMSSSCMSVVTAGNEASCTSTLTSYQSDGYCTGGTNCSTLATCCPDLPAGAGWADTCNQEVGFNNDTECGSLFGTYQSDGYCKGNPGGLSDNCYALDQCCPNLSGADYTSCTGYVSANNDGTCSSVLLSYQDEGVCF